MTTMTKATLVDENARLARENSILSTAPQLVATGAPDATQIVRFGQERYRFCLYGATRSDGGIVVSRFSCPTNRADSISADYLDNRLSLECYSSEQWAFRGAYEALAIVRNTLSTRSEGGRS